MCQTGWRSGGGEGEPDGRAGDYFSGLACAFPGGGGGKNAMPTWKVTGSDFDDR